MRPVLLRSEEPPGDAVAMVRAGTNGVTSEVLRRTATDNYDDHGYYGVSLFAALDLDVDALCRSIPPIANYSVIRTSTVGALRDAGFALLPTGRRPHFDGVLPDLSDSTLERFASCFGPAHPNPAPG